MKILLKNGNIVTDKVQKGNLFVEDGLIISINAGDITADQTVDCTGKYVVPGLIDIHAHFREPGFEYKEDLASGALAAIHGGITTVCCMANTSPVLDNGSLIEWVCRRSKDIGLADILPYGCVTMGMKGEELTEMGDLLASGACGFSDDGSPVKNSEVMRRGLEYARHFGAFISAHEEDMNLTNGGSIHEGKISAIYGIRGIPAESETVMAARDIELARLTKGRVNICHISSRHTVALIRRAKEEGLNVTAEVTHNHLLMTEDICKDYDTVTKINPPLRSEEDRIALVEALKDGTIDSVISDHAPHHKDDKFKEYDYAAFGMIGIQLILPSLVQLIKEGKLNWTDFVKVTSNNPAKILGLGDRGRLAEGYKADITVIDPDLGYTFDEKVSKSKSFNTPYWSKEMKGKAVHVFKAGKSLL